jgi:hypothetical protein
VFHSNIDSYTDSGRFFVGFLIPSSQLLRYYFDKPQKSCEISCFRREVGEKRDLLGYYAACSGNSLPIGCPEMSLRNYHYTLRNSPEECSSQDIFLTKVSISSFTKLPYVDADSGIVVKYKKNATNLASYLIIGKEHEFPFLLG